MIAVVRIFGTDLDLDSVKNSLGEVTPYRVSGKTDNDPNFYAHFKFSSQLPRDQALNDLTNWLRNGFEKKLDRIYGINSIEVDIASLFSTDSISQSLNFSSNLLKVISNIPANLVVSIYSETHEQED